MMKVTVNIDCTPEEARAFFGLPDMQPMQKAIMAHVQEKIMSNIQSHTTSNSTSFVQYAAVEALNGDQSFIPELNKEFRKRRDYMVERAENVEGLKYIYPQGAFYLMLDIIVTLVFEIIGRHF